MFKPLKHQRQQTTHRFDHRRPALGHSRHRRDRGAVGHRGAGARGAAPDAAGDARVQAHALAAQVDADAARVHGHWVAVKREELVFS